MSLRSWKLNLALGCQRKTNVEDRWSAIKVENKESTDRTTNRYRHFKYVFGSPFGWDFLDKSEALHLIIRLSHHHQSAEFSQTFSAKHSVIISICAILWANKQKRDGGKVMKNRSRTVVFDWKRFQWFHLDALVLCKLDACCWLVFGALVHAWWSTANRQKNLSTPSAACGVYSASV